MSTQTIAARRTLRQWFSWQLHCLAYRFDNRDFIQRLAVSDVDGELIVEWFVQADMFGHAATMQSGPKLGSLYEATWEDDWHFPAVAGEAEAAEEEKR